MPPKGHLVLDVGSYVSSTDHINGHATLESTLELLVLSLVSGTDVVFAFLRFASIDLLATRPQWWKHSSERNSCNLR